MEIMFKIDVPKGMPVKEKYEMIGNILLQKGQEFKENCILLSIHNKDGERIGILKVKG
jgi:hypothetical protein